MSETAFNLIKKALKAPQGQCRKNAMTALAVLGGKEGIALLLECAFGRHDSNGDVRRRAELEVELLEGAKKDTAESVMQEIISWQQLDADGLLFLQRLSRQGWETGIMTVTPLERLKRSWNLVATVYPERDRSFRRRALLPGIVAAVVGFFLFFIFLAFALPGFEDVADSEDASTLAAGALFFIPVMVVVITQRTVPIAYQVDLAALMALAVPIMLFWTIIIASVDQLFEAYGDMTVMQVFATEFYFIFSIAMVRIGTIVSAGIFHSKRTNRWYKTIVGACAGMVSATILYAMTGSRLSADNEIFFNIDWALAIIAIITMAAVYSIIDSGHRLDRPISKAAKPVSALLIAACIVPLILIVSAPKEIMIDKPDNDFTVEAETPIAKKLLVGWPGVSFQFQCLRSCLINAAFAAGQDNSRYYHVGIYSVDREPGPVNPVITAIDSPGSNQKLTLQQGDYLLLAGPSWMFSELYAISDILPALRHQLYWQIDKLSGIDGTPAPRLSITAEIKDTQI